HFQVYAGRSELHSLPTRRSSDLFHELGVGKGDHVTLHLPNCLEFMICWFALANIGAIMVPTNPLNTSDEMEYILNHSESVLLVRSEEHTSELQSRENLVCRLLLE